MKTGPCKPMPKSTTEVRRVRERLGLDQFTTIELYAEAHGVTPRTIREHAKLGKAQIFPFGNRQYLRLDQHGLQPHAKETAPVGSR
jgi:hypothetical protein